MNKQNAGRARAREKGLGPSVPPDVPPAGRAQGGSAAAGQDGTAAPPSARGGDPLPPSGGSAGDALREASFSIVGIGASAGGLEALELFLSHVPERSGMGYVVIQHLDPKHKGAMVQLLQRATKMPVVQVKDRQKVEPDCVYVIPPNKDMSILHGVLHLLPQVSRHGLNLPIDYFFRSLAEDRHEASIGVILSGMGSDGTLGLRAIKEKAGAGFVQSLSSAKFDSMPRSAIDAGLADVIATAEELPARIIAYHQHAPYRARRQGVTEERHLSGLEKVFVLLRAQTGSDFSLYKRSTVQRRVERRMGLHQIDKLADYVRYLQENPAELELLFKELLIGVTGFFRDPAAWDRLRDEVLPSLLSSRSQAMLRAWVPGCSTGEEAYSLAIVFKEALHKLQPSRNYFLQVFATDLDREAIETARQAVYPANIAADVVPERLRRFFVQEDRGYRVSKEIRETVVFAPQNIILDPPFTKLDLLSCRNLLIYLSPEVQRKLIPVFHYSLTPGGVLFLGSAETVGTSAGLFRPIDSKVRIYQRLESGVGAPALEFPPSFSALPPDPTGSPDEAGPRTPPPNLQVLADRVIVQRFSPAAVLINDQGDILYISGRTGKYLEPAVGKANLNIFAMAREGLRHELSQAVATALGGDRPVTVRGLRVRTNGAVQTVDLTVQRLLEPRELRGTLMIVITDVDGPGATRTLSAAGGAGQGPPEEVGRELQRAREEVATMREEMQTSQEELKSTNEELQSTNEELQSTNEELTTSKEEMQSMNEELQTVNHELQAKLDDLARSSSDLRNLLNSTNIATLFLDGELRVRRFTTLTTRIIKLIPSDAGRPITDMRTELDYPEFAEDARDVLRSLVYREKEVRARDGCWYTVRIMPYRTLDNVIDGLVITFADATSAKVLEQTLREQASQFRRITESRPDLVWGCRPDGVCDFFEAAGAQEEARLGERWLDQIHPEDRERVREEWRTAVQSGRPLDTECRVRSRDGAYRRFLLRSAAVRDEHGAVARWYGTGTEIDGTGGGR